MSVTMKKILKKIIIKIISLQAKLILNKFDPYIIGIVGAVGKTSTKDSVAAIFENIKDENGKELKYIATKKSLNSEFGVPLTIIGEDSGWDSPIAWLKIIIKGVKVYLQNYYVKYLILEVGADQKGDIKEIATWLKCDMVIMTMYGEVPVHVENFKNRNELIKEDAHLVKSLKEEGIFIYNSDCPDASNVAEECLKQKISFGINSGQYKARSILNDIKRKVVSSQVTAKNKVHSLDCIGVIGESAIYSALPTMIVSDILNFNIKDSLLKIKNMKRSNGRMKILEGKNNSFIIDDSYNSSPIAVISGLKALKSLHKVSRRILILGDMLELGKFTKDEHIKIGHEVASSANILITVGNRAKFIAEGARDKGMGVGWILECADAVEAGKEVSNILKSGDVVYVKGSQSIRLEKAVKLLVSENVDIKKELVRQDKEWLSR